MNAIACKDKLTGLPSLWWTGGGWSELPDEARQIADRAAALAELRRLNKGTAELHAPRVAGWSPSWPSHVLPPYVVSLKSLMRKASK